MHALRVLRLFGISQQFELHILHTCGRHVKSFRADRAAVKVKTWIKAGERGRGTIRPRLPSHLSQNEDTRRNEGRGKEGKRRMTRFAAKCRKILVKRSETARMRTRAPPRPPWPPRPRCAVVISYSETAAATARTPMKFSWKGLGKYPSDRWQGSLACIVLTPSNLTRA